MGTVTAERKAIGLLVIWDPYFSIMNNSRRLYEVNAIRRGLAWFKLESKQVLVQSHVVKEKALIRACRLSRLTWRPWITRTALGTGSKC